MGFVKATVTQGFLLGLLALALLTVPVQATHVGGSCTGHGAPPLTPCEQPDVPAPGDESKTGTAKVIPQAPKTEKTNYLEEVGAFFGAVGSGMGKGVSAVGS